MPYKYKLKEGINANETFIPGVRISEEGTVESATPLESQILDLVSAPEPEAVPPAATEQATPTAPPAVQPTAGVQINTPGETNR